jgi:DNA-directed RNA polymerase specialized sigma24 family protein
MQDFQELLKSVADLHPSPLTGMPRGTETSDPTARLAELAEVYKERIADYQVDIGIELDFAAAIDSLIQELDPDERAAVEQRYKHDKKALAISQKLSISESLAEKLDKSALDKIRSWVNIETIG